MSLAPAVLAALPALTLGVVLAIRHVVAWFGERCGPEKAAPEELGGSGLAPLVDAPAIYVFDA